MKINSILAFVAAATILTVTSVALANPVEHSDRMQMNPEKMHQHMQARLDRLANRLEIKSSQQAAWDEYSKAVESLAERNVKKPDATAGAAAIARYRADRASDLARKLASIADATDKLQGVLSADQIKTFNQASRRFLHMNNGWRSNKHDRDREGHEREQNNSAG